MDLRIRQYLLKAQEKKGNVNACR